MIYACIASDQYCQNVRNDKKQTNKLCLSNGCPYKPHLAMHVVSTVHARIGKDCQVRKLF